jgi:hypothetical protein
LIYKNKILLKEIKSLEEEQLVNGSKVLLVSKGKEGASLSFFSQLFEANDKTLD